MPTNESTVVVDLAAIRADLAELRRYVRTNPAHTRDGVSKAVWELTGLAQTVVIEVPCGDAGRLYGDGLWRLAANLQAGLDSILACPDTLEGYLVGTDWELAVLIGRLEKEASHERYTLIEP